ncbi:MAG: dTDP-glucose 4,6-dehydratase [Planctomycetota bacterium]
MTILITGGAGFIGSNFIRFLREHRPQCRIINYDALTYAGNPANLGDLRRDLHYTFIHADVRDRGAMTTALAGCDAVVHFAAESHVDRSINDSGPFLSTNVLGTQVLLDACREVGCVQCIIHIGTDEVYGSLPLDRPDERFTEESPLRPNSPYAASKAAADLLALAYHRTYDLPVIVTRCSNNFGPYQYPEKVIPLFVTNLFEGRKVPLYGDGLNVRDWLHVTDHCSALLRVLDDGRPGRIYNIGGNNEQSNLQLTRTILDLLGCGEEMIEPVADRPGHDRRYAIDATRISTELGWRPTRSAWPQALAETIEWYRDNEPWWRPLKAGAFNATML